MASVAVAVTKSPGERLTGTVNVPAAAATAEPANVWPSPNAPAPPSGGEDLDGASGAGAPGDARERCARQHRELHGLVRAARRVEAVRVDPGREHVDAEAAVAEDRVPGDRVAVDVGLGADHDAVDLVGHDVARADGRAQGVERDTDAGAEFGIAVPFSEIPTRLRAITVPAVATPSTTMPPSERALPTTLSVMIVFVAPSSTWMPWSLLRV